MDSIAVRAEAGSLRHAGSCAIKRIVFISGTALLLGIVFPGTNLSAAERPNVILIMTDDMDSSHIRRAIKGSQLPCFLL